MNDLINRIANLVMSNSYGTPPGVNVAITEAKYNRAINLLGEAWAILVRVHRLLKACDTFRAAILNLPEAEFNSFMEVIPPGAWEEFLATYTVVYRVGREVGHPDTED